MPLFVNSFYGNGGTKFPKRSETQAMISTQRFETAAGGRSKRRSTCGSTVVAVSLRSQMSGFIGLSNW